MGFFKTMFSPVTAIADLISTSMNNRRKLKQTRIVTEAKITKARSEAIVEAYKSGNNSEAMWDQVALEQMKFSWKDEWILLLFSAPFIGAFVPSLADDVERGFSIINHLPDWYKAGWGVMIASSYGIKKYANFIFSKVSTLPSKMKELSMLNDTITKK